jgi:hypothetical protein
MSSTLEQLNQFSEKPNGAGWTTDSSKITLLADYIWCRTMTPGLTLETFLQRFEPVADYGPDNNKYPLDAVNSLTSRKVSTPRRLDLMALYVDALDLATTKGEELNILLIDYLNVMLEPYLQGAIKPLPDADEPAPDQVEPAPVKEKKLVKPSFTTGKVVIADRIRGAIKSFPEAQLSEIKPKQIFEILQAQNLQITPTVRSSTSKMLNEARQTAVIAAQNSAQPVKNSGQPEVTTAPPEATQPLVAPAAPPPEPPKQKAKRKGKVKPFELEAVKTAAYVAGARIVYTPAPELGMPPARGVIQATDGDTACDIMLDDGSRLFNVPLRDLKLKSVESEPLPDVPFDYDRNPIGNIQRLSYPMSAETLAEVDAKLNPVYDDQLPGAFKIEPAGQVLMDISLRVDQSPYYIQVQLVTAVPQPLIIAKLTNVEQNKIVHVLPPRRSIIGTYTFVDQAEQFAAVLEIPKD